VNDKIDTLGDALPREIARVRDEVLPEYESCGPPGIFAATLMRMALDRASKAMIEGDIVEMVRVYDELKGFKL